MIDTHVEIEVGRKKPVSGVLRGDLAETLVIFVHGLTGHLQETLFYNGARYLGEKGLPTFRYNLYSPLPLVQATLASHAEDLDALVPHFRAKGVQQVYVVGHSYGGAAILVSQKKDFDRIVLWDPTYYGTVRVAERFKEDEPVPGKDEFIVRDNPDVVIGGPMIREAKELDWDSLGSDVQVPMKVITGGESILAPDMHRYTDNARGESLLVTIEGAQHIFAEKELAQDLFRETADWLLR